MNRADHQYGRQASGPRRNEQRGSIPGMPIGGWRVRTSQLAQEAHRLWQDLPALDVVFGPVAEWDTAPLQRLSHLASVLAACDWRYDPEMFDHMVVRLGAEGGPHGGLDLRNHDRETPIISVPAPSTGLATASRLPALASMEPDTVFYKGPRNIR